jgi:hypothetical protein
VSFGGTSAEDHAAHAALQQTATNLLEQSSTKPA